MGSDHWCEMHAAGSMHSVLSWLVRGAAVRDLGALLHLSCRGALPFPQLLAKSDQCCIKFLCSSIMQWGFVLQPGTGRTCTEGMRRTARASRSVPHPILSHHPQTKEIHLKPCCLPPPFVRWDRHIYVPISAFRRWTQHEVFGCDSQGSNNSSSQSKSSCHSPAQQQYTPDWSHFTNLII